LEVPLDYAKPHEEKAAVALIRFPSKYKVDDPRWRGPILYNPVSGVMKLRGVLELIYVEIKREVLEALV
jgi:hypothetical protein